MIQPVSYDRLVVRDVALYLDLSSSPEMQSNTKAYVQRTRLLTLLKGG